MPPPTGHPVVAPVVSGRPVAFSWCLVFLLALGFFARLPVSRAEPASNLLWQRQSIYQIITDRFFDGDPANNNAEGNYDPAGHSGTSVHGGDFRGVEQKLDYIKSLGATALWLSPIVLNTRGEFHGYAGSDFQRVAPHWGSLADLQHLVRAAHARGLLVIDDVVVNHGGDLIDSADPGYPAFRAPPGGYPLRYRDPARTYPPPFDLNATHPALTNLFHNHGYSANFDIPQQVELGELSGLDDFRTESPYVRDQMIRIYQYWIEQAGFDAFRVDTVKHVEMGFWQQWCPAIHDFAQTHGHPDFFLFGEVLTPSDAKCASYTGRVPPAGVDPREPFKFDSVLDYPLFCRLDDVFIRGTASPRRIVEHDAAVDAAYDPAARGQLVTFLDNHDQPRFLSIPGANVARLRLALTFLYTARGIPCLYYGTEQGFNGGQDPWDREDMFAGKFEWGPSRGDNFNPVHPLFQWVAKLNNLRRLYPALQTGTQTDLWSPPAGAGPLAYARRLNDEEVFVALNTADSPRVLPSCATRQPPGTRLINLLNPLENLMVRPDGRLPDLTLPGFAAKIFAAQAKPLDPVVVSVTPAHDAVQMAPGACVTLRFSQPMEAASVEAAFSLVPPVAGTYYWSPNHDAVTFTPTPGGRPAAGLVTVHLGDNARAQKTSLCLAAPFESRYFYGQPAPQKR